MNKRLIVITGPTAVGKTACAIAVANHLQAAVISADSRQLYREMTIGTAKPTPAELAHTPHHFIDSHSVHNLVDAHTYGREARQVTEALLEKDGQAIITGGSGLYISALIDGFDPVPDIPAATREQARQQYETHGLAWLQQQVREADPEFYAQADIHNPHRLLRAWEIWLAGKKPIKYWRKGTKDPLLYPTLYVGLTLPRDVLNERINQRVDHMVDAGLFEEAASLYPYRHLAALQTVGYTEVFDYLENKYDKAEAVRLIKRNTRRYAKRQMTWFKRNPSIHWFDPAQPEEIVTFVKQWIEKY